MTRTAVFKHLAIAAVAVVLGGCAAPTGHATDPGPTVTVTADPKVVTVAVTPQACLDALDAAELLQGFASDGFTLAGKFPDLIMDALNAGLAQDPVAVQELSDKIGAITGDFKTLTAKTASARGRYDAAAEKCRASEGGL